MQYHENSISKHIQKFPKLKIAEPRRLVTQPVRGSKNRSGTVYWQALSFLQIL